MVRYSGCVNSGETVNRPRYTVEVVYLLALWWWFNWIMAIVDEELPWYGFEATGVRITFNVVCNALVVLHTTGGEIVCTIDDDYLKKKTRNVYRDFIGVTRLCYVGVHRIILNNVSGVLHPVDFFIKHLYDRVFPKQCAHAFSMYKRTNPTLPLKLNYLEKFAEPIVEVVPVDELKVSVDSVLEEVLRIDGGRELTDDINILIATKDFSSINIDLTSASGYPYKQGRKKAEDWFDAASCAGRMIDDDEFFSQYIDDHVWYTTGRAKMQGIDDDPAGRLIVYGGFSYLLFSMIVLQPWSRFMNKHFDWCGVGFSWMNDGAGKLARMMRAEQGYAPRGYRYVSLDISGWDTKLHHDVMMTLHMFYGALLKRLAIDGGFIHKFLRVVMGMIEAVILMPLGHCFRVTQGMRSGWGATANDNTLLHEIVFRCIMRRVGDILHILYGDDNLMLVPDAITDETLRDEYMRFGLVVKHIHSSRYLGDVDFLSKHILYVSGHYYVFRESVETHARILMPEEMDPRRRDRPDAVMATERLLGHLLDNPFNEDVRNVCYTLLERLKTDYNVLYVDIHNDTMKKHPWRMFDPDKIPKRFPTVPSMLFIEELYGVPIPSELMITWPELPRHISFDAEARASDALMFEVAAKFSNDVQYKLTEIASRQSKSVIRKLSPYKQPKRCYGFHAARLEFAINFFDIRFNNLLDLGSHPGACAASALKYCDDITCISLKPEVDGRDFCPYVVNDASVRKIIANADDYEPMRPYDLQHDDVDIVGTRSVYDDCCIGFGMIRRAIRNHPMVEQALFTIKELDYHIRDELYDVYSLYGHIDFVKPLFSNPWKSEFMVYVKKSKKPRMRKAAFNGALNAFLNACAPDLFRWSELLTSAIAGFAGVHKVQNYPFQTDKYELEWIREWHDTKGG